MKEFPYLSHDLGARNDPKLLKLQMEMGGQGLAIYWCLVEMLWENGGYLPIESNTIAFSLHWCHPDEVQAVIFKYNLFENDGKQFWSPSALERINERDERWRAKSEGGKKSGEARRNKSNTVPNSVPNYVQENDEVCLNTNKQTNNTNIQTNYSFGPGPEQEKRFLEIFFFDLNLTDPASEVRRFMDYYNANGWTLGKGRKVQDFEALARQWKAEDGKNNRLPKQFLGWFKAMYISASENPGLQMSVLSDLAAGDMKGDQITMTFRTREIAQEFREFVGKNFGNKYNIDWRLRNG